MKHPRLIAALSLFAFLALSTGTVSASGLQIERFVVANLTGFQEVPALVSPAKGFFRAQSDMDEMSIEWELQYSETPTAIRQAHIHVGQPGVNGGISVFLCSNLGNGPAGTPECPPGPAVISGTITADDVLGPDAQGIEAGQIGKLMAAMRAGTTYVNLHTEAAPGGEIRGQIRVLTLRSFTKRPPGTIDP